MIGKVFADRYKIIKLIGTGGMANVYLAKDIMLDKQIAIKILKQELINNRESMHYFRNEAEAISHLSHPNIVEVYDLGMSEGHPYIVMEYIEGKTLKNIIKDKSPSSSSFAIHVMEGIMSALIHSHKKGIIHRDIKPHNIMVSRDGEIKVMDFGIARIIDKNITMTLSTDIIGSVHYLSPEQASGNKITELADVYSAGIVFYEILTGKLPYEGKNPVSVAVNHIQGGLIPPKNIIKEIPQELENIVLKATMRDPKKRFKSALEMNICIEKVRILIDEGKVNKVNRIQLEEPSKRKNKLKKEVNNKEINSFSKNKKNIIFSILFLLFIFLGSIFLVFLNNNIEKKLVPNIIGMNEEEAQKRIVKAGFKFQTEGVFSEYADNGIVISQNPKGNTIVNIKTVIKIKISKGKNQIIVPSVINMLENEAILKLKNLGFKINIKKEFNDNIELLNKVIKQIPSEENKSLPGSEIILIVSKGKNIKKIKMPNLIGQTFEYAQNILKNNNLNIGEIFNEETNNYSPGQIINQSIPYGTFIDSGSFISLTVAKDFSYKIYHLNYNVIPGKERNLEIKINDKKGIKVITTKMSASESTFSKDIEYYDSGNLILKDNGITVESVVFK